MRTKMVSFFIFFRDTPEKIKKLRPKMTKISSRGPALSLLWWLWKPNLCNEIWFCAAIQTVQGRLWRLRLRTMHVMHEIHDAAETSGRQSVLISPPKHATVHRHRVQNVTGVPVLNLSKKMQQTDCFKFVSFLWLENDGHFVGLKRIVRIFTSI